MQCKIEVNNHIEIFDIDKVAKQAAGAALLRVNNSVVLATVCRDETPADEDFLPLTVQYIEKMYAAGRIPGGYVKRETKPSDAETLSARIIDRSLRPLFPKGYTYPTQIVVYVLSADEETDLQVISLNAASMALYLSDIPVNASVCGVRIGRINDEFVLNPSNLELKKSSLDLYLAGVKDELLMIEMRSLPSIKNGVQNMNEFSENLMLEAINFGADAILRQSNAYEDTFKNLKKADANLELRAEISDENLAKFIEENYSDAVKSAINQMAKSERASELNKIAKEIFATEISTQNGWNLALISDVLGKFKRKIIRSQIINERKRADGRALDEVRPISIETNVLPNTHGSCLFTRGQTQALVVSTLGSDSDAQLSDSLTDKNGINERFMFNYNFPGFCVGEASPIKAPGRRELGHGNLAKRALYPSVPMNCDFVIRTVSEILESNGSSSMASVCGGSLSLRAAGINSVKLVAGVAMGLIFEGDKHAILTDIMGLEDHDGDMDFKVAGSRDGITALQMDIKLGGISEAILREALEQAKAGRDHILNLMQKANDEIKINYGILPKLEIFHVESDKIPDIIGQSGKTIKEIIDRFGVEIDLDKKSGEVKISSSSTAKTINAKEYILELISKDGSNFRRGRKENKSVKFEIGEEFYGEVKKNATFGAFISLRDGVDGLLHISKIKIPMMEGDFVKVRVSDVKNGKISLDLSEQI